MKKARNAIFWCHLVIGVLGGLVVLTMSVTGVLLTYEKQIIAWADKRAYVVAPAAGTPRLSAEAMLGAARHADLTPASITVRADPVAPAAIGIGGGRTTYVDPYTGKILGDGSTGVRTFFRTVTDIHRWLGAKDESRAVGKAITGACNVAFLFLVVSGFYLWWPRKWTWRQIRNVAWFRRGLSGKARDYNWHNAIGLWCAVPLFVVVLSGVVISYAWAGNLVYRLAGETPPPPRGAPGPPAGEAQRAGAGAASTMAFDGLDRLWVRAERQVPGWQTISLQIPPSADGPVIFTIDEGSGGEPHKRAQLALDRATGDVVRWEPFSSYSLGRQIRTILRFAHTGEVAGLVGQTVAGLASAGAVVLVWTGLSLSWRRFRAWTARRSNRERTAVAQSPPETVSDVSR